MRKRFRHPAPRVLIASFATIALLVACGGGSGGTKGESLGDSSIPSSAPAASIAASPTPFADGAAAPAPASMASERGAASRPAAGTPRSGASTSFTTSATGGTVDPAGAMLVRQGQAAIEVKHLDDAVSKVRQAASQFGGFVSNAAIRNGRDESRSATLELRVPTDQFDGLVAALNALGKVESVTATAQDVGDEYVDLGARAANARRVEARLTEMLATRTGKLSDVLTMEQELARVREEIERYQSRLKFLERRTALSTLALTLHEPLPLIERQPGAGPVAEAFAAAWERAVGVLAWCIASLGILVPVAIIVGGLVIVVRWANRRLAVSRG